MSSDEQTIILITGANGGIGFELARQLLFDASKTVLVGSRSLDKGEAAIKKLKGFGLPGTVELIQLDVASDTSVTKAAKLVAEKYGRIDALVNNAGVTGEFEGPLSERISSTVLTNVTGPAIVVEAFASLLSKSNQTPRLINVSSNVGSITLRLDEAYPYKEQLLVPYRISKAALNMLTACQAYEYGPSGWKVFAYDPGNTESNLSPFSRVDYGAKPTSEGAKPMLAILAGERDAEHGGFLNGLPERQNPW